LCSRNCRAARDCADRNSTHWYPWPGPPPRWRAIYIQRAGAALTQGQDGSGQTRAI